MNKIVSINEMVPILKEQIEIGGKVSFTPKGISMLPLFRNNMDTVTLIKPKFPLKKYSIAFYQRENGQYVLHRVVKCEEQYYVMRGDNQYINEKCIKEEQIIAVVSEFTRKGKHYKITDKSYRVYCVLWTNTIWFRKCYKKARRLAGKIKRKLLGNK